MTTPEPLVAGQTALAEGRWDEARGAVCGSLAEDGVGRGPFRTGVGPVVVGREPRPASTDAPTPTRSSAGPATSSTPCSARCGSRSSTRPTSPTIRRPMAGSAGPTGCWYRSILARCMAWPWSPGPTGCRTSPAPRSSPAGRSALARAGGDVDLELGALSQLGLIRVGRGDAAEGFALIDEAMAGRAGRGVLVARHRRLHLLRHAQRLRAGERCRTRRPVVRAADASPSPTAARSCMPSAASPTAAC